MKKEKRPNHVAVGLAIAIIVVASVSGLIVIGEFVGWFYHAAQAGTITGMTIHQTYKAIEWHGFAGTATLDYDYPTIQWNATIKGGNTTVMDVVFNNWGKSGYDMYISPVPLAYLDLDTVVPATTQEVDAYIGIDPSERVSATSTWKENFTIDFGGTLITGPGFRTKRVGLMPNTFHQVALKDSNGTIFFGCNATRSIPGFDGALHNFQVMVPVPYNVSSMTYYIFPDPITDELGGGSGWTYVPLSGIVRDDSTGLPLANVSVHLGESTALTNGTGYYELLARVGDNFIIGQMQDYFDYVDLVTVEHNGTNIHDFNMSPSYNQTGAIEYGFVEGKVFDNLGTPIVGAQVIIGSFNSTTDAFGNYSMIAAEGQSNIVAIQTGYKTNVSRINITAFETTNFNITLMETPFEFGMNGTVYGRVRDVLTNETIENATVYIGSWSTDADVNGDYTLTVPSFSDYTIVGTAPLYDAWVGNLSGNNSVLANQSLNFDIYLNMSNWLSGLFNAPPGDIGKYTEPPGVEATSNLTEQEEQKSAAPGDDEGSGLIIKDEQGEIAAYLSIKDIKTNIKQDSYVEQTIAFYNFKDVPMQVKLAVEGDVTDIFKLSSDTIDVESKDYGEVDLTFLGIKPPGLYKGTLIVSGAIETEIPIEIRISKEGKIPIKTLMMNLDVLKKAVIQGTPVKYKLDMVNLFTDRKYNVDLRFYVADLNGTKVTNTTKKSITLETFTSLVGQSLIPKDLEPGDYIVRAQADYLGLTSSTDALFSVREPFYQYNLFGVIPIWLLATLLALASMGIFIAQEVKRRSEAKKRFHAKIDYNELPDDGDRSLFVGNIAETSRKTYFDMDRLTVHSIVAGSTGGGKSISAQDIIEECLLKDVAVAVFDPTAQWSGMLRKLEDKKFLEFYAKFGMDPKKDPRGFNGNIKAVKNGREIIDIFKYLRPGEIQIFTTNTLDPKDYDIFVASMIQQIFHSKLDEFRGLKYLLVFDEIHRILPKFGGSGAGFTQIERGCREFRKWGIGIVLISQVLSDFVGEIKANINTLVQMKTRDEGDLDRIKMQYGEEYIQSLVKSPVGSGMVQNSSWNRGKPYYITFRPILHSVVRLTDEELDKYNKYNEIVEQLDYEFDQLEETGQDVFDLRLELKLSKDKIKSGNFNMVQIYLDGLTPRVQKMWEKLGKKPKKLEIQLLDTEAIDEAVKKAKEEKEKKEKAEGGAEGGAGGETAATGSGGESGGETVAKGSGGESGGEIAAKGSGGESGGEIQADAVAGSGAESKTKPEKPVEAKPAELKPVGAKPVETKPAEKKPVTAETPVKKIVSKKPGVAMAGAKSGAPSVVMMFNQYLSKANGAVKQKNRPVAVQMYRQLSTVYQKIPQAQKSVALKHITALKNAIGGI